MKIAVRADASTSMGVGHLKRCLSLAEALREEGASVQFVTRDLDVDASSIVRDRFPLTALRAPTRADGSGIDSRVAHAEWAEVSWRVDAEETAGVLGATGVDTVIVDHYAFDAEWHVLVAGSLGSRIVAIDDLADRSIRADILIDQTYSEDHAQKYAGLVSPGTRILGGPGIAMLDPTYAAAPRYEFHSEVRSIGLFMGGVDRTGCNSLAYEALRTGLGFRGGIEVVTTSGNKHLPALRALAEKDTALTLSVDLPSLSEFYARHDLQVGAGGGATWERCCIGAPSLVVGVAENQWSVLLPIETLGVAAVSRVDPPTIEAFEREIKQLIESPARRRELAERAVELVDGRGAQRLAAAIVRG